MSILLWSAAFVGGVTFIIHTFAGGKAVAEPLLADKNLPIESKWLNYYCWHITTILIAFIAAAFAWLALNPEQAPMIILLSALTASLSFLSIAVALKGGINPLRFPSTSLFASISALGWAALLV
ncbi:MAG: hypothetical protein OQJ97_10625 [Rhodospirillales bacterium]|nr:hypothetical protein [Rhodospirillales bacterium]